MRIDLLFSHDGSLKGEPGPDFRKELPEEGTILRSDLVLVKDLIPFCMEKLIQIFQRRTFGRRTVAEFHDLPGLHRRPDPGGRFSARKSPVRIGCNSMNFYRRPDFAKQSPA